MELSQSRKARRNRLVSRVLFVFLSILAIVMACAVLWLYMDKFGF